MANYIAQSKITLFKNQFSAGHFELAKWAMFPVGVTADMLYQLWSNFKEEFAGPPIPMVAVSDVLLSTFFKPIGKGIFEPDKEVRTALLEELRQNTEGVTRLQNLAFFVTDYARQRLNGEEYASFRDTLLWNADATIHPAAALRDISRRMQASLETNNRTEILRLRELLELFAIQEKGVEAAKDSTFNNLLQFSIALKGGFMNASAPQILQKVDNLGLVLSTEKLDNAEKIQLPTSLVSKGVLQKMTLKKADSATKQQQILAMLVGVNDYVKPFPSLKGSGNDVELLEKYLKERFEKPIEQATEKPNTSSRRSKKATKGMYEQAAEIETEQPIEQAVDIEKMDLPTLKITKLFNQSATKSGILEQFKFLASQAQADDFVFFSFSGLDVDAVPNADKTIDDNSFSSIDYNANSNVGSNVDNNVGSNVYGTNAPPPYQSQNTYKESEKPVKIGLFMPFDGRKIGDKYENYFTGDDLLETVKMYPAVNFVFWLDSCKSYCFFQEILENMVVLNACSTEQTAKELQFEKKTQGAFTALMVQELRASKPLTYAKLIANINKKITKVVDEQTPFVQAIAGNDAKIFLQESLQKRADTEGSKKPTVVFNTHPIFRDYFKNKLNTKDFNYSNSRDYAFEENDTLFAIYDNFGELKMSEADYKNLLSAKNIVIICNYLLTTLTRFLENKPNVIVFMGWSEGEEGKIGSYSDGKKYGATRDTYECGLFIKTFVDTLERNKERTLNYTHLFSEVYRAMALKTDAQRPQLLTFGTPDLTQPFLNGALQIVENEPISAQRLQVGIAETLDEKERQRILAHFDKTGKSLFFDLLPTASNVDYLIEQAEKQLFLRTPYDPSPVFAKEDGYNLDGFFNNIDAVANWYFTLELKQKTVETNPNDVLIEFYKINKNNNLKDVLEDWKVPIVLEVGANEQSLIKLKITNTSDKNLFISVLYLGKDFSVTNQFLRLKEIIQGASIYPEYENAAELPMFFDEKYAHQNKKQITEYFKIFVSEKRFDTDAFNRDGLSLDKSSGPTRSIGRRSALQTSQDTENMVLKTVILTLKLVETR
jgi:hypothetical protein